MRFVEQNLEMALGRPPAWVLLEMLLYGEVGASLPCYPPTLAGKAGPMKSREACCMPGLLSERGCSRVMFLNAHCLLWEIRLLGTEKIESALIAELSANIW